MDKILFDFDMADQQLSILNNMSQSIQDCMRQMEKVLNEMDAIADSRTMHALYLQQLKQVRAWRAIANENERLTAALKKVKQKFADTERELKAAAGVLDTDGVSSRLSLPPLVATPTCVIGSQRLTDFGYPDWLSVAAQSYFYQS